MKSILRWGGTQLCQCPVLGRLFCLLPWWLSDTLTAPSEELFTFFCGGGTGVGHFSMKNGCSDMEITDSKQGGGADLRLWPPWPNLIAQLLEGKTYITYLKGSRELTIPKRSPDLPGVYVFFLNQGLSGLRNIQLEVSEKLRSRENWLEAAKCS